MRSDLRLIVIQIKMQEHIRESAGWGVCGGGLKDANRKGSGFRALVCPRRLGQLLEGASAFLPLSVFNLLPLVFINGPI